MKQNEVVLGRRNESDEQEVRGMVRICVGSLCHLYGFIPVYLDF